MGNVPLKQAVGEDGRRACRDCGKPVTSSYVQRGTGKRSWKYKCSSCYARPYRRHLKARCEQCGFIPLNRCQLDIDHIDGNHRNNDVANLRTLCANCHRLVSHMQRLESAG